jgi:hypothetical protein
MSEIEVVVELIKEVQQDLTNQINSLGDKLSIRISALENVGRQRKTFIKSIFIPLLITVLSGSAVYMQDHIKLSWNSTNVQSSK